MPRPPAAGRVVNEPNESEFDYEGPPPWHRGLAWALPTFGYPLLILVDGLLGREFEAYVRGALVLSALASLTLPVIAGAVDGAWCLVGHFLLTWWASLALFVAISWPEQQYDDGLGVTLMMFFVFCAVLYVPLVFALFGFGRLVGRLVGTGAAAGGP